MKKTLQLLRILEKNMGVKDPSASTHRHIKGVNRYSSVAFLFSKKGEVDRFLDGASTVASLDTKVGNRDSSAAMFLLEKSTAQR